MAPKTLNLDSIVDVNVTIGPQAAPRATFNQLLIIGNSTHISAATRLKKYASVDDMLNDSFIVTDPEYIAANIYFSQSPAPDFVWIGRHDTTGAETCVQALTDARSKSAEWYAAFVITADTKQEILDCAAYIETATPASIYGYTTSDSDVLNNVAANVAASLQTLKYSRTIGQYATTQSAAYPNNVYAIVGILGYAMGQNSGLANSAFTLKFKEEVGIATEPLTTTQVGVIEELNCNLYLSYGNFYSIFEQGKMANGQFFDEVINLDMLTSNIQLNVMDLLYGNPKVPQTDAGVNQLIHQINQACDQSLSVGFLGAGQWTGQPVLNLNTGDMLPNGYLTQASKLSSQSSADRAARKSPPIYVAIKEAGAIHSVLIGVYVNR